MQSDQNESAVYAELAELRDVTEEVAESLKGEYVAIALDERVDDDFWPVYYIQDVKGTWLVAQRLVMINEEYVSKSLQFIDLRMIAAFRWIDPETVNISKLNQDYEEEIIFDAHADEGEAEFESEVEEEIDE